MIKKRHRGKIGSALFRFASVWCPLKHLDKLKLLRKDQRWGFRLPSYSCYRSSFNRTYEILGQGTRRRVEISAFCLVLDQEETKNPDIR